MDAVEEDEEINFLQLSREFDELMRGASLRCIWIDLSDGENEGSDHEVRELSYVFIAAFFCSANTHEFLLFTCETFCVLGAVLTCWHRSVMSFLWWQFWAQLW